MRELSVLQRSINYLFGGEKASLEDIKAAYADEIGEVMHALKGAWAWWKPDRVRWVQVEEEVTDTLFFYLSYWLAQGEEPSWDSIRLAFESPMPEPDEDYVRLRRYLRQAFDLDNPDTHRVYPLLLREVFPSFEYMVLRYLDKARENLRRLRIPERHPIWRKVDELQDRFNLAPAGQG